MQGALVNDAQNNMYGTGLGMSIVKEFGEVHGGRLDIRSQAGQPPRLCGLLPAAPDDGLARTAHVS